MHAGISFYQRLEGHLPATLADVCHRQSSWRRLLPSERWTRDGWGDSIGYLPQPSGYVLRSARRDRIFDTADDIVFDSEVESRKVAALAGCYQVAAQPKGAQTDMLRFSAIAGRMGGYEIDSAAAVDARAVYAEWYPGSGDSIVANWVHIDSRGLSLRAVVTDGRLEGRINNMQITAQRTTCR